MVCWWVGDGGVLLVVWLSACVRLVSLSVIDFWFVLDWRFVDGWFLVCV